MLPELRSQELLLHKAACPSDYKPGAGVVLAHDARQEVVYIQHIGVAVGRIGKYESAAILAEVQVLLSSAWRIWQCGALVGERVHNECWCACWWPL